ncbi:MAG: glycosyltransferase [Usitatibacter sp.]
MADETNEVRPVQLHVIHDLGGGSAKWLRDFGRADSARTNLVLRSFTLDDSAGCGVVLHADVLAESPIRVWKFANPIVATVTDHAEHRAAFDEVLRDYRVAVVLVSSLIGHSLEVLDSALPTAVVCHDYFPYCPAINIYFGSVCRECDAKRIGQCHRENECFNPFVRFTPQERVSVRQRYLELVRRPNVTMVVPSHSVEENLVRLNPLFKEASFVTIPHGYGGPLQRRPAVEPARGERLRVIVLGQLSVAKGSDLLREALGALTRFADLYLIGCREMGELFRFEPHVHVMSSYDLGELPMHVANINPHVGLLTSIVPETFSYALSELMMLGVPVAATRVGSFAERIRRGENGYLFEPDCASLVGALKAIDSDRDTLGRIRANIREWQPRKAEEMVADYHRVAPVAPRPSAEAQPMPSSAQEPTASAQTLTMAGMRKEMKSLHLKVSILGEARDKEQRGFTARTAEIEEQLENLGRKSAELGAVLDEKERQILGLTTQLNHASDRLAETLSSTSWRVTTPLRFVGTLIRKLKLLARALAVAAGEPKMLSHRMGKVARAWRAGGMHEVKKALLGFQPGEIEKAWANYRQTFRREVRPRIVERIRAMDRRPLVSVIVPTYNTPDTMLREMLESVQAQLYGDWELCIADDGSPEPRVRKTLEEFAAREPRIKLHLGGENKGVSHASNRALEMATGELVVLLDHDDILEEQALFRVAQSLLEDRPDIVYSDEALITPDGGRIMGCVFRPAFSPEFLKGHPYIVHLVGLRTQLVRDIGGFDESLRISQDYDLILRAVEKSRKVVHIPEILYQWRFHSQSAGHQKMHEVMQTSCAVLQRHLDRSGMDATAREGPGFNFFDVRYRLRAGLRVAIIIPTKNHGALLRQCIDSIRATVHEAPYDIWVVDHESQEPETLAYLASIAATVRMLRYEGSFNFSAINNWAVSQLSGEYSHYLFCNNDIEAFNAGWLGRMLELGQQPSVGIVGARLFYPDRRTIQHAGVCVGAFGRAEHYGKFLPLPPNRIDYGYLGRLILNCEVAAVTAACLLIRKDAFDATHGFDEAIAVGFGDVDLCLRVGQAGYRVLFCPHAELVHHESMTRGTSAEDAHPADTALYKFKWRSLLEAGDPYYNPGFSLASTTWAPRRPMQCSFEVRRRIVSLDRETGRENLSFSGVDKPIRSGES